MHLNSFMKLNLVVTRALHISFNVYHLYFSPLLQCFSYEDQLIQLQILRTQIRPCIIVYFVQYCFAKKKLNMAQSMIT